MFKYNVPFETIIGLKSHNPIVRYVIENIHQDDKIVACYEPVKENMPTFFAEMLEKIDHKKKDLKMSIYACTDPSKIDLTQLNDATMLLVCGSNELINGLNRSGFDKNIPIIIVESEPSALNALNCIYIENGTFNHCKFNRTIVADNSSLISDYHGFNRLDNGWMFALSLINLIKNERLNPLLTANYAACVDFFSWFISYGNSSKSKKKRLTIIKKGIACFYNAFNNDVDNEINKKILGNAKTMQEFKINCVTELQNSFEYLKQLPQYGSILDKYNIPHHEIDEVIKFYTSSTPIEGGK